MTENKWLENTYEIYQEFLKKTKDEECAAKLTEVYIRREQGARILTGLNNIADEIEKTTNRANHHRGR